MATPEEKTQEEISKNIKTVTKLIQAHSGNPAQIKAKQDEEKKLVKEHKKVLGEWTTLLDEEQKQLEQNKVRVTTMTSFIGLEAKKYFAETERNMVTWGGLFKSLKTGVKNWFDAASKQNTMLGRTLRLGASLWKGVNDHIIGTVKNVFGKIGSEVRDVLGELAGVFDFIKGIFMGVFNFIKDAFMGFFQRVPPHDRKRNQYLRKMVDFMRRAEKRDMLEFAVPKKGFDGILMTLAIIAAALVGGMVRRFLMPFEAIMKLFRIGPIIKKFKDFLLSFKWLANIVFKIKWTFIKWGRWIKDIFSAGGALAKFGGILGKLFTAFKFGFKFLGWPLTIILGVIDFIRGFISTEGNLADKITGGVKGAILGFLELPVKLLGWIVEKVLGIFGVEVDGVADKILGFIKGFIDIWVGMFRPIIGAVEGLFKGGFKGMIAGFFGGIGDFFKILEPYLMKLEPIRQAIIDFFQAIGDFFSSIIEKFRPLLEWFGIDMGTPEGAAGGITGGGAEAGGAFNAMTQAEAKAEEAKQEAQTEAVVNALDENTQKQMEHNKKLSEQQTDNIAVAMATSSPDTKPAADVKEIPEAIQEAWSFMGGAGF